MPPFALCLTVTVFLLILLLFAVEEIGETSVANHQSDDELGESVVNEQREKFSHHEINYNRFAKRMKEHHIFRNRK